MPSDLALLSTLIGSNYPFLELIFMVSKVFEPLKFDCTSHLELKPKHGTDDTKVERFDPVKFKFPLVYY